MCGGGSVKKAVGGVTKVATLGITDDPVEAATVGTVKSGPGGSIEVVGQTVVPGVPQLPDLPIPQDPEALKTEAASKAAAEELSRRRRIQAGGRQATLLAGQDIAAQAQQRKTLLGQ